MQSALEKLRLVITYVCAKAEGVSAISLMAMISLVAFEVTARRIFGFSTLLMEEYIGYLLVVLISFGLGDALLAGEHITIDMVRNLLPSLLRDILMLFSNVVGLVFSSFVSWQCLTLVMDSYTQDIRSIMHMRTPIYIPQMFLAVGMTIFILAFIVKIAGNVLSIRKATSKIIR